MSFNPGANRISSAQDAALSNPVDGQVLSFNDSTQKWANVTPEIATINGLQPALDDKAAVDPVAGLSKVMVLGSGDPVPVDTPAGTVIIELSE